jgi:manganese oxidase
MFATTFNPARFVDRAIPNDNRQAAGTVQDGVLSLDLEARMAEWHPDGDAAPGAEMMAFAEIGKPAQIPGPLVRVVAGTRVRGSLRNSLPNDTMLVYGLHARPGNAAPLKLGPGETRPFDFMLESPGTYLYWATTMRRPIKLRTRLDSQLSGAIVVDERGKTQPADRILLLGMWSDSVGGAVPHGRKLLLLTVNGLSWPHTERMSYTVGDTVRWRVINASADLHPMHLHGFYFHVDSRGNGITDSAYAPEQRDFLVTDLIESGHTLQITWVPDRDGNWAYHCHIAEHIMPRGPLGVIPPDDHASHITNHATQGMSGLVTAIHVSPRPGQTSTSARGGPGRRRFRLVVQDTPNATRQSDLRFALGEGGAALKRDTLTRMGPPIVVNVGEPVSVMISNTTRYPTSVHWHGLELESYFDGIAGLSGTIGKLAPVVASRDSFEARFTPPRAGTFIYHSHVDELEQQPTGLIGAVVVLAPGQRYNRATDLLAVVSTPVDSLDEARGVAINGSLEPTPLELKVGTRYRLRIINITTARPGLRVAIRQDSSLVRWKLLARDGAELPPGRQVEEAANRPVTIGQTIDVELKPQRPGTMQLKTVANVGPLGGTLELRVSP